MADQNRTGTTPAGTTTDDDLAQLRHDHPEGWSFRVTTAGGRRLLVAEHDDGGLLSARTAAALDLKIITLADGAQ